MYHPMYPAEKYEQLQSTRSCPLGENKCCKSAITALHFASKKTNKTKTTTTKKQIIPLLHQRLKDSKRPVAPGHPQTG